MKEGPHIASIAALLGDPARANMLTALMDGRALTVGELARVGGVALPTASGHLAKLRAAGLLTEERQGRARYLRLSGSDVGDVLEALMGLAQRTGALRVRTGPADEALRAARVCYDHLAGGRAVRLMDALLAKGLLLQGEAPALTKAGVEAFEALGVDVAALAARRRPLCRACLDWSERRPHLGGAVGAAVLKKVLEAGWAKRGAGRVVAFSPAGEEAFDEAFGLDFVDASISLANP
jgi:DNA-binding transcriptional ArsR family regulator